MKKTILHLSLVAILFFLVVPDAKSQYEHKLSLNLGLGAMNPQNELANYFSSGASIDGALHINFSKRFAMMIGVKYFSLPEQEDQSSYDLYYNHLGVGIGFRLKLTRAKKFVPYLFVDTNIDFVSIAYDEYSYSGYDYVESFNPGVGLQPGGGLEWNFGDHLALFGQASYLTYLLVFEEFNAQLTNFQLGIRFSFAKSKEL